MPTFGKRATISDTSGSVRPGARARRSPLHTAAGRAGLEVSEGPDALWQTLRAPLSWHVGLVAAALERAASSGDEATDRDGDDLRSLAAIGGVFTEGEQRRVVARHGSHTLTAAQRVAFVAAVWFARILGASRWPADGVHLFDLWYLDESRRADRDWPMRVEEFAGAGAPRPRMVAGLPCYPPPEERAAYRACMPLRILEMEISTNPEVAHDAAKAVRWDALHSYESLDAKQAGPRGRDGGRVADGPLAEACALAEHLFRGTSAHCGASALRHVAPGVWPIVRAQFGGSLLRWLADSSAPTERAAFLVRAEVARSAIGCSRSELGHLSARRDLPDPFGPEHPGAAYDPYFHPRVDLGAVAALARAGEPVPPRTRRLGFEQSDGWERTLREVFDPPPKPDARSDRLLRQRMALEFHLGSHLTSREPSEGAPEPAPDGVPPLPFLRPLLRAIVCESAGRVTATVDPLSDPEIPRVSAEGADEPAALRALRAAILRGMADAAERGELEGDASPLFEVAIPEHPYVRAADTPSPDGPAARQAGASDDDPG